MEKKRKRKRMSIKQSIDCIIIQQTDGFFWTFLIPFSLDEPV
jgi:hypothetical protein